MVVRIIILIFVILLSLSIYKIISSYVKKQLRESERIISECKTEEERQSTLNMLKKKNMKRAMLSYLLFVVCLSVIAFVISLVVAKYRLMH